MTESSKTAQKQRRKVPGIPFQKGDLRINRKGRPPIPKNQAELNKLIDDVMFEEVEDAKGAKMQKLRVMLNKLMLSKSPAGQIHILDRRYGKVPQAVDVTSGGEPLKPPQIIEVIRTIKEE